MDRKPKTVFQLDSPFTAAQWPQISSENQEIILELLCSILSPIGQHRFNHTAASKGKRSKRRKRREAKLSDAPVIVTPLPPETLKSYPIQGRFSVIFICRSPESSILHAHFPQLVYKASLEYSDQPPTRLVELPPGSEARLARSLGLPRVSSIGILEGAPHSTSLIDLIQTIVPEIEIPWLKEAKDSRYLPVKINAIDPLPIPEKKDLA